MGGRWMERCYWTQLVKCDVSVVQLEYWGIASCIANLIGSMLEYDRHSLQTSGRSIQATGGHTSLSREFVVVSGEFDSRIIGRSVVSTDF